MAESSKMQTKLVDAVIVAFIGTITIMLLDYAMGRFSAPKALAVGCIVGLASFVSKQFLWK